MSFKDKIIKKILNDEREKFLIWLVKDPAESLRNILKQYSIPFENRGTDIVVPVGSSEEIVISVKKQKQKTK